MKKQTLALIALFYVLSSFTLFGQGIYEDRQKRTEWFRDARFGMFIHSLQKMICS